MLPEPQGLVHGRGMFSRLLRAFSQRTHEQIDSDVSSSLVAVRP
jgi:hypothetical protein